MTGPLTVAAGRLRGELREAGASASGKLADIDQGKRRT